MGLDRAGARSELAQAAMRPKSDLPNAPSQWRWQSDTVHSGGCGTDADVFALLVMGESMTPEVEDGDVIIVEPGGAAKAGSFVLALSDGQWIFRQWRLQGQGWWLCPLHCGFPRVELADLALIRGIVIQKSRPARRSATRHDLA